MGGTLAELANYIQLNGGTVLGSIVLVNAGRNINFIPVKKHQRLLEQRFYNEIDALRQKKQRISAYYQKVLSKQRK